VCGRKFITSKSNVENDRGKYCSRECSDFGRSDKIELECNNCGRLYKAFKSQKGKKFCSNKCKCEYLSGPNHPSFKSKIEKHCMGCGKKYYADESRKNSKYCSLKCAHKALIGLLKGSKSPVYSRVKAVCPVCRKEFTVKKSQAERCADNCCSRECAISWSIETNKFARENNSAWEGGISFLPYPPDFNERLKEKIRERDGRVCQLCGISEEEKGKKQSVHHIDYDKNNCDEENLIALCHDCHIKTNLNREDWFLFFTKQILSEMPLLIVTQS
jgi:hypothetical protein